MSELEILREHIKKIERRLRLLALFRGVAAAGSIALAATVLVVWVSNRYAFSDASLTAGRVVLFLGIACALGFALAMPLTRISYRRAAREAERANPELRQRLLTIAERESAGQSDVFLELLAADTVPEALRTAPSDVVRTKWLASFASATAASAGLLLWLVLAGPGFWGHGARLLWAGPPKSSEARPFYDIEVKPGDCVVRRGGSQMITARLIGFDSPLVRLFARYENSTRWEETPMLPAQGGASYEFLLAGVPSGLEYYVDAGRLRSKTYRITVVDVPSVQRMRLRYKYPAWSGLPERTEDPASGDVQGVEGTEVEIALETDRPLSNGQLVLEDGTRIELEKAEGNWRVARLKLQQDSSYYIAAMERGESVRLTDDFFIEVQKDTEPLVRIVRPGRDARVLPIEEVTVEVQATDDFGLNDLRLHYSVNGGPPKEIPLLKQKGVRQADGSVLIALEDYKLVPGDVISIYASARDARHTARTDIFFIEAQPYEREYTQSQQIGGGMEGMEGMGGMGGREGQISQRQKEIIAATWNQLRDPGRNKQAIAENARFLSEMQSKLRDQALSLATRMTRRELSEQNEEFQGFARDMTEAAKAMGEAAGLLKSAEWEKALAPEQKALQHLLRAEATFREIQVAFGNRGQRGGGGGGNQARDLESLFDLELDLERNQYETAQRTSTGSQREREIDEALQRLEQLARRQQELASQMRQPQQTLQQRWQQELLRREAEELQRRIEQLARGGGQGQQGQVGQQGEARVQQALERLRQAAEDMRRAASAQASGQNQGQADSRRAAERLREAENLLRGLRAQQAQQRVDDLAQRADRLASAQQDFQRRLEELFREQASPDGRITPQGVTREQLEKSRQMASERDAVQKELERLTQDMQQAARELAGSERAASSRIRNALGELQQNEIQERMRFNNDLLRRGYGPYVLPRERPVTEGLNRLREQLREARAALSGRPGERTDSEQALAQLERLRNQLRGLTGQAQDGRQSQGTQQQGSRGQQQAQGRGQQGSREGSGQGGQQGAAERGQDGRLLRDGEWRRLGRQGPGSDGWQRAAINRGDYTVPPVPPVTGSLLGPAEADRMQREAMRVFEQLRQAVSGNPVLERDLDQLIREFSRLDLTRIGENPLVQERIRAVVLPHLEQLELQLRRQSEDQQASEVRSPGREPVPPGYTEAVAEYFRRLSKGK